MKGAIFISAEDFVESVSSLDNMVTEPPPGYFSVEDCVRADKGKRVASTWRTLLGAKVRSGQLNVVRVNRNGHFSNYYGKK